MNYEEMSTRSRTLYSKKACLNAEVSARESHLFPFLSGVLLVSNLSQGVAC